MIIDADVHTPVPSKTDIAPHLPPYWQQRLVDTGFRGPYYAVYPPKLPTSHNDTVAGTDDGSPRDVLREAVLEDAGADYAVLNCSYAVDSIHNPDEASAFASGTNDWLQAEWLADEPRFLAGIVLPTQDPRASAAEIARVGDADQFVQINLPLRSQMPYGRREYLPLFEAAVERDLVVSLQYGGFSGNAPTPVGWPTYQTEEYVGMASAAESQLISLISEGVFAKFPTLRVVVEEVGFSWLPGLLWRFDKEWKGLRREVPWVRDLPSEYIRKQVRFTTSPFDIPLDDRAAVDFVLDEIWSGAGLLFSTDYPHWNDGRGATALMNSVSEDMWRQIMGENAADWYRVK
jgi:uncharacterized protein